MAKKCNWLDCTTDVLVLVGALNWGLVGLGGWNVVNMVLGGWPGLERLVYVLVGLSALWVGWKKWGK